jgi:hypothetical protein
MPSEIGVSATKLPTEKRGSHAIKSASVTRVKTDIRKIEVTLAQGGASGDV